MDSDDISFVAVEYDPGGTGGYAELLALKKGAGRWKIVARLLLWVS
jgi:hypothetical protein